MKTILTKAQDRGAAQMGWLNAKYSFSFANYYNPLRIHFGTLRVLNDDLIAPDNGFGTHPHDNMEIISIPLAGQLAHKDSTGGEGVISRNEVQIMSAGTGVYHSEFNPSKTETTNLLQIWLFPKKKNIAPRYGQMKFSDEQKRNTLLNIINPVEGEGHLSLNQDAWFYLGNFDKESSIHYKQKKQGNGSFLFVIEGEVEAGGQKLQKRDSLGISETDAFDITVKPGTELLLMDIPMTVA
ncbi:pirin family protein [Cytophagales bacterium LB-30]|uniref:Pirin family protein n=1 Tax=Shiella aurantiaca TaxID=3058365 RepID=A0ABT8F3S1_9BACT|nr:pirin family protein [Shiella aurantiaca]MDN4164924.1 pirin family protein [Shiella aurantiaca]